MDVVCCSVSMFVSGWVTICVGARAGVHGCYFLCGYVAVCQCGLVCVHVFVFVCN